MMAFTYGLTRFWAPPALVSVIFVLLAGATSLGFIAHHDEVEDRKTFRWYEVSAALLL